MLDELIDGTVKAQVPTGLAGEIRRRINLLAVEHVLVLAYGDTAAAEVRAEARLATARLLEWLKPMSKRATPAQSHYALLLSMMEGAREDGAFVRRKDVAQLPPGSPI